MLYNLLKLLETTHSLFAGSSRGLLCLPLLIVECRMSRSPLNITCGICENGVMSQLI